MYRHECEFPHINTHTCVCIYTPKHMGTSRHRATNTCTNLSYPYSYTSNHVILPVTVVWDTYSSTPINPQAHTTSTHRCLTPATHCVLHLSASATLWRNTRKFIKSCEHVRSDWDKLRGLCTKNIVTIWECKVQECTGSKNVEPSENRQVLLYCVKKINNC
jgi:hypothetical protein